MKESDAHTYDAEKSRLETEKLKRELKMWLIGPLATLLVASAAVVGVILQVKDSQIQQVKENWNLEQKLMERDRKDAIEEKEHLRQQVLEQKENIKKLDRYYANINGRFEAMYRELIDYEKQLTDLIDEGDQTKGLKKTVTQIRKIIEQIPLERIDWREEELDDERLAARLLDLNTIERNRLKKLYLDYNEGITKVPQLDEFRNLEKLDLRATGIRDLSPLAKIKWLKELDLTRTRISEIDALKDLTELVELDLSDCEDLNDFDPLAKLGKLERLDLDSTSLSDEDVAMLGNLSNLRELHIQRTKSYSNIKPLAKLTKLKILKLGGTAVEDISPLLEMAKLTTLYLPGALQNDNEAQKIIDELQSRLSNRDLVVRFAN